MDGNRDGEGSGEGTKGVAVEEGGRSSAKRTCDDLNVDGNGSIVFIVAHFGCCIIGRVGFSEDVPHLVDQLIGFAGSFRDGLYEGPKVLVSVDNYID